LVYDIVGISIFEWEYRLFGETGTYVGPATTAAAVNVVVIGPYWEGKDSFNE